MNPPSRAVSGAELELPESALALTPHFRRFCWSVRRELWENRYLHIVPLVAAAVVLVGFLVNAIYAARGNVTAVALQMPGGAGPIEQPYAIAAILITVSGLLTAVMYCLDALQGERRDRSILFWKSLPVSDLTAVLSKAAIPLAVVPLVVFSLIVATHVSMLFLNMCVRLASGTGAAALRAPSALFELWIALLYGGTAIALWLAPVYGWLLLVSAWARRAALLWAALPLLAACVLEKIAFNTRHFEFFLEYRFLGWFQAAFASGRPCCIPHPLATVFPAKFLSTPGLWTGLALAALFLAGAARLRRSRGPI